MRIVKFLVLVFSIGIILYFIFRDHRSAQDMMQKAEYYGGKGDIKMANLLYDEIMREYPNYAGSYINKGVNLAENGDYSGAIAIHKKGLLLNPSSVRILTNIACYYDNLNSLDSANQYFSAALKLVPKCETKEPMRLDISIHGQEVEVNSFELLYLRGQNYFDQKKYDLSIADLKECIRCGYYVASCHYLIGACLFHKGEFDESCKEMYAAASFGHVQAQEELQERCSEVVKQIEENTPL